MVASKVSLSLRVTAADGTTGVPSGGMVTGRFPDVKDRSSNVSNVAPEPLLGENRLHYKKRRRKGG